MVPSTLHVRALLVERCANNYFAFMNKLVRTTFEDHVTLLIYDDFPGIQNSNAFARSGKFG